MDPEVLVSIQMRLPQLDRTALSQHLSDVVVAAIAVGGMTTSISLQPYDPEDEDE